MDLYPFETVPGLLTPELEGNLRTRTMLGAAQGLLSAAGWSKTPINTWEALGRGLQGGLTNYAEGTNDSMRQQLVREQIAKMRSDAAMRAFFAKMFGGEGAPGGGTPPDAITTAGIPPVASAAPRAAPAVPQQPAPFYGDVTLGSTPPEGPVAPAGLLSPSPVASQVTPAFGTVQDRGNVPPQPPDLTGLLNPTPMKPQPQPQAAAGPPQTMPAVAASLSPQTVRQTRMDAASLQEVIAKMPAATRQVVAGMFASGDHAAAMALVSKYLGIGDKPSDTTMHFKNTKTGEILSRRSSDADADRLMHDPDYVMVSQLSANEAKGSNTLVTLRNRTTGEEITRRAADPEVTQKVNSNEWEQITTPSSNATDKYISVTDANGAVKTVSPKSKDTQDKLATGEYTMVTTPSGNASEQFLHLQSRDGTMSTTIARNDPRVKELTNRGWEVTSQPPANVQPRAYLLDNGRRVLSRNGTTYRDEDGKEHKLGNATPLDPTNAYDIVNQERSAARAASDNNRLPKTGERPALEDAAKAATGPYSTWQAAVNATVGGLGFDKLIGQDGLFRDTVANRQYLRLVRQTGKAALVNNPRFPQKEQETVDELFPNPETWLTNPRTEQDKVSLLRERLNMQLRMNNDELQIAGLDKQRRDKLTTNNLETARALELLGPGSSDINKTLQGNEGAQPKETRTWREMPVGETVIQKGRRFRKNADGSATDLGPAR